MQHDYKIECLNSDDQYQRKELLFITSVSQNTTKRTRDNYRKPGLDLKQVETIGRLNLFMEALASC